jgi:phosphoribosylformimino-5-aminoimidazole carboxamide ribotide isomerase
MIIFPAIDLRRGQCVRLLQGDPNAQTTYADDPAEVAAQFEEDGAEWLHVVNLDGAFGDLAGASQNTEAIQSILDRVDIPLQVGGGIRTIEDIEQLLNMGVTRIILGTMAVERPRQIPDLIARFGAEQIVVGIDARDGKVAIHGWRNISDLSALDLGKQIHAMGVIRTVYTDISRDGALTGINLEACKTMGEQTGLKIIISGGVASLEDVRQAKTAAESNIEGLIIGRALYTGDVNLADALNIAKE